MTTAHKPSLVLVCLLAVVAVAGPWAWFHVGAPSSRGGILLADHPGLAGYVFRPDPLSQEVLDLLSTTNVVNGSFINRSGEKKVTVFRADWLPTDGVGKTLVNHTPDVCWVNTGWRPVDAGQPDVLQLRISGQTVPFECRVFEAPDGPKEVIVWCTLVNGEPLTEPFRFQRNARSGGRVQAAFNLSRLAIGRFLLRIERRIPASGHKQFFRFSIRMDGDVGTALNQLGEFGAKWISAGPLPHPDGQIPQP